ncbi:hypothetical protein [Cryobacterium psychrophilum]|uniref:Uncharacterized protein n=1 Tax=Cryobacterium psychrophilum TaxID=41988 RepID=A0A4Y8KQ30_9MICO|nr:hypothetical protein [Cryobacterium psychrophilum]TDW31037.1 hypothetical protein EDD25_2825 [Cryobacterium psychrophilum]TFD80890.1 hypothetical protein E3T53_04520 [Cryobacterium psychrophilum]
MTSTSENGQSNTATNEPSKAALFMTGGVLTALLIVLSVFITVLAQRNLELPAEIALTVWMLLGLSALLVVLTLVAWISRIMDGEASRGALNLPNGSISAVIALLLLLLFAFSSIYIYSQVSSSESQGKTSTGVSETALARFPSDRVLSINVADAGAADGTGRTYDVELAPAAGAAIDFAKTLFSTLSTVVVAIVGFYFGQRATTSGIESGQKKLQREGRRLDGNPEADPTAGSNVKQELNRNRNRGQGR